MTKSLSSVNLRMDHLGAMQAFIKVVDAGSFSAAAKEMHLSISSVTRRVSSLEETLNTTLLHRTTHAISLTEAGHICYGRMLTIIADLEDTYRAVAELNSEPSGPLKLTAPVAFGRRYLSPLIAQFLERYPTIQLDVRLTDNHNDLVAGGFDLDIHEGENYLDNLVVQAFSRNDSVLCASPNYLDQYGRPNHPEDLQKFNCLRYVHPEGDIKWNFSHAGVHTSIVPQGNLASDHSELLLDATCSGLGIAEFEVWLVRDLLISGALEIVLQDHKLINKLTGNFIYMAYLSNRRGSAKVKVLKDFLFEKLKHIGELSGDELRRIGGAYKV
jgi:DNA-binding transcriptional LysR family regulator